MKIVYRLPHTGPPDWLSRMRVTMGEGERSCRMALVSAASPRVVYSCSCSMPPLRMRTTLSRQRVEAARYVTDADFESAYLGIHAVCPAQRQPPRVSSAPVTEWVAHRIA